MAHASLTRILKVAVSSLLLLLPATSYAQTREAGNVTMLTGRGTAISADADIRNLNRGDAVFSKEVLNTGPNSYLNVKFSDGSLTLLRPNSRFEIAEFEDQKTVLKLPSDNKPTTVVNQPEQPKSSASRAFFRLLKGGFRTVTGLIGSIDKSEYQVTTPVATIGIRGTDYLVVLCDAACAKDPVVKASACEGAGSDCASSEAIEGGLIVGVISGGVFVRNEAGETAELDVGQYLYVLPNGTIVRLPFQPRFLTVNPIPNPATCVSE